MITPTHVVINVALAWRANRGDAAEPARLLGDPLRRRLFVLGGLAPDVGLYAMTTLAALYYPTVRGMSLSETFELVFDDLFYNAPAFIVAHNLLHAPLVVAGVIGLGAWLRRRTTRVRLGGALQAFGVGCLVHTAVDIPVHHDDGPLLLFPFEWSIRFASPVSYYDPAHHGSIVAPIDLAITVVGVTTIGVVWWRRRRARRREAGDVAAGGVTTSSPPSPPQP